MLRTLFPYGTDCGKAKAILIDNQLKLPFFLFKIRLVSMFVDQNFATVLTFDKSSWSIRDLGFDGKN